ncbi:putative secondary metabolism biosynthetic enzyme [Pestalotiopsis sp. 9143b]|nr:putative secondary metabolism biosynthetic enzyme [Pestalotiopsis sp. 9143b]
MAENTVQNKSWVYKQIPEGLPKLGLDTVFEDRPISLTPPPGGVIVKILVAGLDPHQRDRMRGPDFQSYVPGYNFNETITNFAISRVIKSDNPDFKEGDLMQGLLPVAEYGVIPKELIDVTVMASHLVWKVENKYDLDYSHYMGPLGLAGMTAWNSFYGLVKPEKGKTIWVNAATSSVGEVVVQLAKKEGMRVIASVSSAEKLKYVTEVLGADAGFNYREEDISGALKRLAPEGLDVVYENVGGEHFQAAIENLNWFGRIIVCGMASQYNKPREEQYGVTNLSDIFRKRITIRGFIYWDHDIYEPNIASFQENMPKYIADGSIKASYSKHEGLETAHGAFLDMFTGKAFGKAVIKIADE